MEKQTYLITRIAFCSECYKHGRPYKDNKFLVFRSTRRQYKILKNKKDGIRGFVPTLFVWEEPYEIKDGMMTLLKSCAIHECGLYIPTNNLDDIETLYEETITIPYNQFLALRDKWRGYTGYNLL